MSYAGRITAHHVSQDQIDAGMRQAHIERAKAFHGAVRAVRHAIGQIAGGA